MDSDLLVYLVTGDRILHIKVGYWTSTIRSLFDRYKAYFGLDCELHTFQTPTPSISKVAFKNEFRERNIALESFDGV